MARLALSGGFQYNTATGRCPVHHVCREAYKIMSSVPDRVKKIVVEQLGVKEEEVNNDASFVDDLGADSLDTVELVMALEEEFECEIPDDEAERIRTVQNAVDYIVAHVS